jgi:hypothetical protein
VQEISSHFEQEDKGEPIANEQVAEPRDTVTQSWEGDAVEGEVEQMHDSGPAQQVIETGEEHKSEQEPTTCSEPVPEGSKVAPVTEEPLANIDTLTLRTARQVARALNLRQKYRGKDFTVAQLRSKIKDKLAQHPELKDTVCTLFGVA